MRPTPIDEAISWIYNNSRELPVNCADLREKLMEPFEVKWPYSGERNPLSENDPVVFFTPWGPKYTYKEKGIGVGEPERLTLDELGKINRYFSQELGISTEWRIMFADIYGTQINGLPEDKVNGYFANLEEEISKMPGFMTMWWSKTKDCKRYAELEKQVTGSFFDYIAPEIFSKNIEKSKELGGDESNARAYSVERVVEGLLIQEMYDPLKFSLVASKNDVLDGPLRRVYVVENRKPWLK